MISQRLISKPSHFQFFGGREPKISFVFKPQALAVATEPSDCELLVGGIYQLLQQLVLELLVFSLDLVALFQIVLFQQLR
jgi:hypothetical protein